MLRLSYGDGITFWPVVELVRAAAAIRESDPPEVAVDRIRAIVAEIDQPARSDLAEADFFRGLLDRVMEAVTRPQGGN